MDGKPVPPARARSHFEVVDALRGGAAIYVLLYHASPALAELPIVFWLLSFGHQGVVLFFVLSGFCIHLKYANQLARSPESALPRGVFAKRRFWRLYPTFFAALLVTLALDGIGRQLDAPLYQAIRLSHGARTDALSWAPEIVLGNLLCLQPHIPVLGTNGPLWSLSYETSFYLLYPLFFLMSRRLRPWVTIAISGVASLAALAAFGASHHELVLPFGFLALWVVWAFGAAIAEIVSGRWRIPIGLWTGALSLAILGALSAGLKIPSATLQDYAWGVGFSLLIVWLLLSNDPLAGVFRSVLRPLRRTAKWSYSVYLVQAPVIALLHALGNRGFLPYESAFARFFIEVVGGLIAGYALYAAVERRFSGQVYVLSRHFPFLRPEPTSRPSAAAQ